MKTSIKKLFSSLQFNILILILLLALTGLIMLSAAATQQRIDNIELQGALVKKSLELKHSELDLSKIEAEDIANRLPILIEQLGTNRFYDIVNKLLMLDHTRRKGINTTLAEHADTFSKAMGIYFNSAKNLSVKRRILQKEADSYLLALFPAMVLQAQLQKQYFYAVGTGLLLILLWALIVFSLSRHAYHTIFSDISTLLNQDKTGRIQRKFLTAEINQIALKLRNEVSELLQPSKTDTVTQLLNYDGIKSTIEQGTDKSKKSPVYACVFEIDNYSKLANHYPQNVIDPIMIKIASIMKLHKMQKDLLGRIDDSMFLVVFNRKDKKKAFEDCDNIRQMVEESSFKMPHNSFPITISGGFSIKTPSQSFEEVLKNAKSRLKVAQEEGGNSMAEVKKTPKFL